MIVGTRKSSDLECFHWVNTLLGNIKSSIQGTYHGFEFDKYAARYLSEFQYRFNRRFDLPPMVQRLLRACALTAARPEKWLRSAEAWGKSLIFFLRKDRPPRGGANCNDSDAQDGAAAPITNTRTLCTPATGADE